MCIYQNGYGLVDGKWYCNSPAGLGVTIDSAGAGNYRIDRIVLRADWAGFAVHVHVIKNVADNAPAPAITQTPGTTYDVLLYQARVTDGGVVTLTDERLYALPITVQALGIDSGQIAAGAIDLAHMSANSIDSDQYVDGSIDHAHLATDSVEGHNIKDGEVIHAKLADDSVETHNVKDLQITQAKLATAASKVAYRQGGEATGWYLAGANDYTPTSCLFVIGSCVSGDGVDKTITFQDPFGQVPLLFISWEHVATGEWYVLTSITVNTFVFSIKNAAGTKVIRQVAWMAIGTL